MVKSIKTNLLQCCLQAFQVLALQRAETVLSQNRPVLGELGCIQFSFLKPRRASGNIPIEGATRHNMGLVAEQLP